MRRFVVPLMLWCLLPAAHGQKPPPKQPTAPELTETQKEIAGEVMKFAARWKALSQIKNQLEKKEALDEHKKKEAQFAATVRETLTKNGAINWVGRTFVFQDHISISDMAGTNWRIELTGLSADVKAVAKGIVNGEWVRFSIASNAKIKVEKGTQGGVIMGQAPGSALTKIARLSP